MFIQKSIVQICPFIVFYSMCFFIVLGIRTEEIGEVCKIGNVVPHPWYHWCRTGEMVCIL